MHLPAAGLGGAKLHLVAEALQQRHHGFPGIREQGVVVASDEE